MPYRLRQREQITFNVDGADAIRIREEAARRHISISAFLRDVVLNALPNNKE